MALINDSVQVYGLLDLVEIWRELDGFMLDYWREQDEKDKAHKAELEKKAQEELEKIVSDLEDGNTGLEKALKRYEDGVSLLRRCYEQLRKVEQRIVELTGKDDAGNPLLRPFNHESSVRKSE